MGFTHAILYLGAFIGPLKERSLFIGFEKVKQDLEKRNTPHP